MQQYTTALAANVQASDGQVAVTDPTGILNPGVNGTTQTTLSVGGECMQVDVDYVNGETLVPVVRGFNGTLAEPHSMGDIVQVKVYDGFEFTADE